MDSMTTSISHPARRRSAGRKQKEPSLQAMPLLLTCLRAVMQGRSLTESEKAAFSDELLLDLLRLSRRHDLAHFVGYAFDRSGLSGQNAPVYESFRKAYLLAVMRYEQLHYEFVRLCQELKTAHIPFIPLKGSVLRAYYPEPWLRTSGDIDILIHSQDADRAVSHLTAACGYVMTATDTHVISLLTKSGKVIEMHRHLAEMDRVPALNGVWEAVSPREDNDCCFVMDDTFFYLHHIAHMAKHFLEGGCGIRSLLDLWVLNHRISFDREKREALLKTAGLLPFEQAARRLSETWFSSAFAEPTLSTVARYVVYGGVYGTRQNHLLIEQNRRGSKIRYTLSRIFLPYETMKCYYPVLTRHKWLTPLMHVRRWGKLLFCGGIKRSVRELQANHRVTPQETDEIDKMLRELELS